MPTSKFKALEKFPSEATNQEDDTKEWKGRMSNKVLQLNL